MPRKASTPKQAAEAEKPSKSTSGSRTTKTARKPKTEAEPEVQAEQLKRPVRSAKPKAEPVSAPKETKAKRTSKRKIEAQAVAAPATEAPKKASRRPAKKQAEQPLIANLVWRQKGVPEPEPKVEAKPSPTRKSKSRRADPETAIERPKRQRPEKQEPKPKVPPAPPAPIEPPPKRPIQIPAEAAQVALKDGMAVLAHSGKVVPPVFFFAYAPSESALTTVLEQAKMASEHGVHTFGILTELEVSEETVDDAVAYSAFLVKKLAAVDSQCKIVFRTVFVAQNGWERKYPRAKFISVEGGLADPSVADDQFWDVAASCLKTYIQKLRRLDSDGRVLGVHLERGEWFNADSNGYDTSVASHEGFRDWLRHRYRNDVVSLQAAWFDGSVQFETVGVPEYGAATADGNEFVRTDRKARKWVDYHLYISDATCERIAELAYVAKEASEGEYLVGASYGYTFEWSHPANGHLSLGKLLRCRELDYIAGPPSYKNREPGGSCAFPGPIDSFTLNGKLYISEEDFKTPISSRREPDDFNPVMKTPQALENVHWRGAGAALAHGTGVCWMDSWGNGWLNSLGIWQRAGQVLQAESWRLRSEFGAPDVAVFIDERSLAYLLDARAFEVLVQNVRESVLRSGLTVGFYLLSDLAHRESFPECKLHVFVNAWDMRPEVRSAIKTRLQKDGKVLFWLYCAGLFEGGRESLERVREVTGIALRPQPFFSKAGTTLLNLRDPICQSLPEEELAAGGQLEPSYFAIPEEGVVLGEYTQTGLPSFVVRKFKEGPGGGWTSVFLGEPIVSPGLFRALGQMAGAHVWSFQNDVVHVRPPFLCLHANGTGQRTIALPEKWAAYNIIEEEWMQDEGTSLRFHALDGSTSLFLVGPKAEIAALLDSDSGEPVEFLPDAQHGEDTMHWESMKFDVPIMKLDEWVEEAWSDELADDLLLKPSMLESVGNEPPDEEALRSRGRSRRRKRRSISERAAKEPQGDDTINVLFRKRT